MADDRSLVFASLYAVATKRLQHMPKISMKHLAQGAAGIGEPTNPPLLRHVGRGAMVVCALLLPTACQLPGPRPKSPITGAIEPPPFFAHAIPTCQATKAKFLLGRVMTVPLLEEAKSKNGVRAVRTVLPDSPSALPFEEGRLLVDVDRTGRAIALRCS